MKARTSSTSRQRAQQIAFGILTLIALATVIPIIVVVIYIVIQGAPAISGEFITGFPSDGMRAGGILPAIVGTFYLTLGTALFSVPLGVGAAIYLSEYASENRWTRLIRIAIINLAGIPSVVYGLFGLGLFVLFLNFGTSILAGSLTLSIMTLPVIISTSEEALRAVPQAFRVVSISLGATRWQTIRRIVLPEISTRHPYRGNLRVGKSCRRNCTNPVYSGSIFPAPVAPLAFGCYHGPALSPVCHFYPGTRNASQNSVRNRPGFTGLCVGNEPAGNHCSLKSARSAAVVEHILLAWQISCVHIITISLLVINRWVHRTDNQ